MFPAAVKVHPVQPFQPCEKSFAKRFKPGDFIIKPRAGQFKRPPHANNLMGWQGTGAHSPLMATAMHLGLDRSEEHTSELQSRPHLVCRLLLEKKKTNPTKPYKSKTKHS